MATMRYQPMLAHPAKDEQAILKDKGFVAERKYDGHRAMLEVQDGKVHLFSRLGNDNIHHAPFLLPLAKVEPCFGRPFEVVIDGELVVPGGTSSDVADLTRKDELVYVAFDFLASDGVSLIGLPYQKRRELLEEFIEAVNALSLAPEGKVTLSEVSSNASELLAKVKSEGGEGIMMKKLDAPYCPGKRSWGWQKCKVFTSYDVVVTGCDAEPTKWTVRPGHVGRDGVFYPDGKPSSTSVAGYVGLTYGWHINGQLVKVGKLGHTGLEADLKKLVGKVAEVKGYGLYSTGAIRHPVVLGFRDDKKPEECEFIPEMATL